MRALCTAPSNPVEQQRRHAVGQVLRSAKTPLLAREVANLARLDITATTVTLRGLMVRGEVREATLDGKRRLEGKAMRWAWVATESVAPSQARITPHLPSTQPNGSVKFWNDWSEAMNTPARLELSR